ncbi:MAG: hypothetical protein AAB573_04800 [Patescibacteria group bacterium]
MTSRKGETAEKGEQWKNTPEHQAAAKRRQELLDRGYRIKEDIYIGVRKITGIRTSTMKQTLNKTIEDMFANITGETVVYPSGEHMTYYPYVECVNTAVAKMIASGSLPAAYAAKQGYPLQPLPPYVRKVVKD